jgi:hypothetical protein
MDNAHIVEVQSKIFVYIELILLIQQDMHIVNTAGYAKREARKKSCNNKYLQEEYKKYKKIIEKQKKNALDFRKFKNSTNNMTNNEILKKNREFIQVKWKLKRQLYKSERCLANFIQSGIHLVKKNE